MLKKHKNYMESWCFWSFLETAGKTLEQFLQMAGNAGSRNVLQTHQKPFQGHRKKTTKMKSILFYIKYLELELSLIQCWAIYVVL